MKKLFTELMASMTLMRASLIHPVMPGDGREITMKLSPTRNKMLSKVGRKIASQCVCCTKNPTITVRKQDDAKPKSSRRDEEGGSDEAMESSDAEDSDYLSHDESDENDDEWLKRRQKEIEIKGPLVPVPEYMCDCSKTCRHFIHSKCLECIESGEAPISICPRCHDLHNRLIRSEGSTKYCSNISLFPKLFPESRGITPSTKIQAIIDWFLRVPKGEKAIIYSLFTESLDFMLKVFLCLSSNLMIFLFCYTSQINERVQYRSNNPSEDRILSNMKDLLQRLLQINNSDEDE